MSILQKSFHLVDMNLFSAANPKMLKLPRTVATELVLLSVLAPLVVSDIAVGYCSHLFASDASLSKGAIVKSDVGEEIAEVLWRSCRTKGGYSKLLDSSQSILSRCMDFEETGEQQAEKVDRPLAFVLISLRSLLCSYCNCSDGLTWLFSGMSHRYLLQRRT